MSLFAIGDLHLSGTPAKKPMDVFGPRWKNHWQRIQEDWRSRVSNDDTVLIAGDTSWAMHLKEAQEDLDEIRALPGKKIIIRGNHDYWWESAGKLNRTTSTVRLWKRKTKNLPFAVPMDGSVPVTFTIVPLKMTSRTGANSYVLRERFRKRKSSVVAIPYYCSTTRRSAT